MLDKFEKEAITNFLVRHYGNLSDKKIVRKYIKEFEARGELHHYGDSYFRFKKYDYDMNVIVIEEYGKYSFTQLGTINYSSSIDPKGKILYKVFNDFIKRLLRKIDKCFGYNSETEGLKEIIIGYAKPVERAIEKPVKRYLKAIKLRDREWKELSNKTY